MTDNNTKKDKKSYKLNPKKLTELSLLLAIAVIMGYVEAIIPINIGIPGVKLGLANIVSVTILYTYGFKDGLLIGILRTIIVAFLFTNMSVLLYSLTAFLVSFCIMGVLKRTGVINLIIVSILGGIVHNVTQLIVAFFVFSGISIFFYMWILLFSGAVAGLLVGLISIKIIPIIKKLSL